MEGAHDSAELERLEQELEDAVRRSRRAGGELAGSGTAVPLGDDDVDRRIHAVLARLNADTYSIPLAFRSTVVRIIDRAERGQALNRIRQNKHSLWPIITRERESFGLPEDLWVRGVGRVTDESFGRGSDRQRRGSGSSVVRRPAHTGCVSTATLTNASIRPNRATLPRTLLADLIVPRFIASALLDDSTP
jgi:hypothetical protein